LSPLEPIDFDAPGFGDLYDELPLWSAPFGLWILDRVPLKTGSTLLDLGAGTGFLSIEMAERCGAHSRVLAVDPWAAGMDRLRRKVEQRGLQQIQLLQQDAATLDLPPASVDVIVSNLGLNNFEDPAAVLRICAGAARPGASLLLTTNLVGHMAEFYSVYSSVLVATGQAERVAGLQAHVQHRASVDGIGRMLEGAGFAVDDIVTGAFRLRFADGTALLRHHFIRLAFVPAWKALAAAGRVEETFDKLESALNDLAAAQGELALTIPTAGFVARRLAA
jgi:ubiquinone/menaquinone biosynthesis C-methylase UbiE